MLKIISCQKTHGISGNNFGCLVSLVVISSALVTLGVRSLRIFSLGSGDIFDFFLLFRPLFGLLICCVLQEEKLHR